MLENFSAMIEAYDMIPNGNRVYYTKRSQPPLFIAMVDEYYKVSRISIFPISDTLEKLEINLIFGDLFTNLFRLHRKQRTRIL